MLRVSSFFLFLLVTKNLKQTRTLILSSINIRLQNYSRMKKGSIILIQISTRLFISFYCKIDFWGAFQKKIMLLSKIYHLTIFNKQFLSISNTLQRIFICFQSSKRFSSHPTIIEFLISTRVLKPLSFNSATRSRFLKDLNSFSCLLFEEISNIKQVVMEAEDLSSFIYVAKNWLRGKSQI